MKRIGFPLYLLILALWFGGMAIFTFLITPTIFSSFPRDMAGEIVGRLFPGYFWSNLVINALAIALFIIVSHKQANKPFLVSSICLLTALMINLLIVFRLHPEAVRAKQAVTSFESESPDSPARKRFARLHGVSAVLNLVLISEGAVLLATAASVRRKPYNEDQSGPPEP
jgi:hypothetical protein